MKNGIVADFFCGSGTTLAAACTLGWQWIGCDSSPRAIHISKKRIINLQSNNICSQSFMVQFLNSPEIQPNKSASQCDLEFQIGQVQIIKQQPDHLLIHIPITGISRQTFPINDSSQRDRLQSAWRENNMAIIDLIELDWGKTSEIFQSQIQFSAGFGKNRVLLTSLIECKIPFLNNGQLRIRLTDLFGEVAEQMIVLPSLESIADPRKK